VEQLAQTALDEADKASQSQQNKKLELFYVT
jgi:hypothetical protein